MIFLTGGSTAAAAFRKRLKSWDLVKEIWTPSQFGQSVHMEAVYFPCLVHADGSSPVGMIGAQSRLVTALALIDRPISWIKNKTAIAALIGAMRSQLGDGARRDVHND